MDEITIERWQDPETPGTVGLKLSGSMTIAQAAGLKEELARALGEATALTLDLSGLDEIDLTGMQLLGACRRSALEGGKRFGITTGDNQAYLAIVANAGFTPNAGSDRDNDVNSFWLGGMC